MGSKADPGTEDQKLAGLTSATTEEKVKPQKGMARRIWSAMGLVGHLFFRSSKEDFEKRLQHLSAEEVAVHNRLKRRTQLWRKFARNIILYSVIGEVTLIPNVFPPPVTRHPQGRVFSSATGLVRYFFTDSSEFS